MKVLISLLFLHLGAMASVVHSGGTPRNLPCRAGQKVFTEGDVQIAKEMDPQFFNWEQSEERLFQLHTGECMHLPFWVGNAKSLNLFFAVPLNEINKKLKAQGLEAIPISQLQEYGINDNRVLSAVAARTAQNGSLAVSESEFAGSTLLGIAGNDYPQTAAGPIRPTFVYVYVKPSARCYLSKESCQTPSLFLWKYYVNTERAKYAGEETWGLQKMIGSGSAVYGKHEKNYRYYDSNTEEVFEMKWDEAKNSPVWSSEQAFEMSMLGVTQMPTLESEKLKTNPGQTFNISKWAATGNSYGAFNFVTDRWRATDKFEFMQPFEGLSWVKPFMWQYLDGLKIVYYTDEAPAL